MLCCGMANENRTAKIQAHADAGAARDPMAPELQNALIQQANLRITIGIPMTVVWLWLYKALDITLPPWAYLAVVLYGLYAAATLLAARTLPQRHNVPAIYCTAVADALVLVFWLPLVEDAAGIILALSLFTGVGYALRTGLKNAMLLNQAVTLVGYLILLGFHRNWLDQPIAAISFPVPLIIVPAYTAMLLDKLQAARLKALEESQAKSDMLAKVSHGLRTPLGGIVSAAELIHIASPGSASGNLANTIIGLAKHLQDDIADLLDQAKNASRALVLNPGVCDIRSLMFTVEAALQGKAAQKHVELQIHIDPRLEQPCIADNHYLARVLLNLASNAIKFTDVGSVVVRVIVLDETPTQLYLRFSVEDTGHGILPRDLERIFEPFVQVADRTGRHTEGTGLGLPIARSVVEAMGGELRVTSEPGRGSRFWFDVRLPRAERNAAPAIEEASPVPPRRILVVDDNVTNLHLLAEVLEQDGHIVTKAESGNKALDYLVSASPPPDVIFLDYALGDMDGVQMMQIYHFGVRDPAPVYFVSADTSPHSMTRMRESAAKGIITKPVRLVEIRQALAVLFPQAHTTAAPKPAAGSLHAVPIVYVEPEVLAEVASFSRRPEFLGEMIDRSICDIDRSTASLIKALEESRWDEARKHAHAMRGVAQQMGAFRLKTLCATIMQSDVGGLEGAQAKLAAEVRDLAANTIASLKDAYPAAARPNGTEDRF